ncbi:MAG: T9SS type A sorting domain-containing protein [Chitinophagales bacterium]
MNKFYHFSLTAVLFFLINTTYGQNPPDYEQRRDTYIDTALANFDPNAITLQAYRGETIDQSTLNNTYGIMHTKSTIDFNIVKLVRVLFLGNGTHDSDILNALDPIPFWYNYSDTLRGYWSENHMIMWMSSDWLLHESYGKTVDNNLENRLKHYLQLKIDYGFYEFFSSTYMPYCLSGLLNLADFAQDPIIKDLATQAAQRLLTELLMVTNDKGVFYPAAGRNYYGKYENPYNQNHYNLVYLLKGFGPVPSKASHGGGFLASSGIDVSDVISSWRAEMDTIYKIGHSIDSVKIIHQNQSHVDRIMFQWSSGCYFHPDFAQETAQLHADSNTWDHVDFEQLNILSGLDPATIGSLAAQLTSISESSVIAGQSVAIYKNRSVVLTSIQDFWKGKLGYQQFPLAATIENTAVFPVSGALVNSWGDKPSSNANDHLPYVEQKSNVALMMYRGEEKPSLFGNTIGSVSLHWFENDFDEITTNGLWLLGRVNSSYVAVKRHCEDKDMGLYACHQRDGQSWAVIVGNDSMYGSFSNFQAIVDQAAFEENWYFDESTSEWVYYASIEFDNKTISHEWRNPERYTSIKDIEVKDVDFQVYPNPAQNQVNIDLSGMHSQNLRLSVSNMLGQTIYRENNIGTNQSKTLDVTDWSEGVYFISIEDTDQQKRYTKKLIKVD